MRRVSGGWHRWALKRLNVSVADGTGGPFLDEIVVSVAEDMRIGPHWDQDGWVCWIEVLVTDSAGGVAH